MGAYMYRLSFLEFKTNVKEKKEKRKIEAFLPGKNPSSHSMCWFNNGERERERG